jgi:Ca2+:H+ antiporter
MGTQAPAPRSHEFYGMTVRRISAFVRYEWVLFLSAATCLVFFFSRDALLEELSSPPYLASIFLWLFAVLLGSALSVVRHADHLALRLGEPYGTLILTLSVTFIEVTAITAVKMHGESNPTLTRDTLFAVVMIILNGMVGLSLLLGGWLHREQHYNLQGANAYLGVIVPLVVLSLILPVFTQTVPGPFLSFPQEVFLVIVSVGLYCAFLTMQMSRHRGYFTLGDRIVEPPLREIASTPALFARAALLIAYLVPVVFLAQQLAHPVDYLIETLHAPAPLGGVIMAVLVSTPEAIGAVRAAMTNQLQRSINIFLGSVLSTIGLTIPAMVLISHLVGEDFLLGLEHTDIVMLSLTLLVSVITFASGHTNVMQGAVHLILFATYLLLIVNP